MKPEPEEDDGMADLDAAQREKVKAAGLQAMLAELNAIRGKNKQAPLIAELRELQRNPTRNKQRINEIVKELGW